MTQSIDTTSILRRAKALAFSYIAHTPSTDPGVIAGTINTQTKFFLEAARMAFRKLNSLLPAASRTPLEAARKIDKGLSFDEVDFLKRKLQSGERDLVELDQQMTSAEAALAQLAHKTAQTIRQGALHLFVVKDTSPSPNEPIYGLPEPEQERVTLLNFCVQHFSREDRNSITKSLKKVSPALITYLCCMIQNTATEDALFVPRLILWNLHLTPNLWTTSALENGDLVSESAKSSGDPKDMPASEFKKLSDIALLNLHLSVLMASKDKASINESKFVENLGTKISPRLLRALCQGDLAPNAFLFMMERLGVYTPPQP